MTKKLTPIKAIRHKCLDCCCHQKREVRLCPCTDCSLWPYRMGVRPGTHQKRLLKKQKPRNFQGKIRNEYKNIGKREIDQKKPGLPLENRD